jgi:hypothetical protein
MKKTLLKILKTIGAVPLCLVGAVCLIPFAIIFLLIDLPLLAIDDIWHKED